MSINQDLKTQRQLAAVASGGFSSGPIYTAFEGVLKQLGGKGDLLDFGAGIGNFTQRLQTLGGFRSITAIDIMQRPSKIDDSISWISQDLNYTIEL